MRVSQVGAGDRPPPPRVRDPRVNPLEILGKGLSAAGQGGTRTGGLGDRGSVLSPTAGGCVTGCGDLSPAQGDGVWDSGGPRGQGLTISEERLGQLAEEGFQEAADDVQVLPPLQGTEEAAQTDKQGHPGDSGMKSPNREQPRFPRQGKS